MSAANAPPAKTKKPGFASSQAGRRSRFAKPASCAGGGPDIEISEATGRDERDLSEPWYGLYYDTRAEIVGFENLRAGDVVEVQYTVADVGYSNEFADYFGDFEMIADSLPTRRWDYTLIAPKARTFYFNPPRLPDLGPKTETRGDDVLYKFEARHVARIESEPAMPGFAEIAPYCTSAPTARGRTLAVGIGTWWRIRCRTMAPWPRRPRRPPWG
jgi:hypothetical protein